MSDHGEWMLFGGGFMWLFWIVGLLVVFVIFKSLINSNNNSSQTTQDSALEILKKRYARGEINDEEYEQCKKKLE